MLHFPFSAGYVITCQNTSALAGYADLRLSRMLLQYGQPSPILTVTSSSAGERNGGLLCISEAQFVTRGCEGLIEFHDCENCNHATQIPSERHGRQSRFSWPDIHLSFFTLRIHHTSHL